MKYLINFNFRMGTSLCITVPDLKNKYNYYYEPTESLSLYDEINVFFNINENKYFVLGDTLQSIIAVMVTALSSVQDLPPGVVAGTLGEIYNKMTGAGDFDSIDFSKYWLWSGKNLQVWIYKQNNEIHLEVSPTYQNLLSQESDSSELKTFLETYQVLFLTKMSGEMIDNLIKQGRSVLNEASSLDIKS